MNVKATFNVSRTLLVRGLKELVVKLGLIRWTISFVTSRQVKLVLNDEREGLDRWKRASPGRPSGPYPIRRLSLRHL